MAVTSRREGKRVIFETGLLCNLVALVFLFMAFVSPYWIISWPRVHSGFKRVGLWEACFAGLVLPTDPSQKAYHGCWWILAPEYWDIRSWLMPGWFVFSQIAVTVCFVAEVVGLIIMFIIWVTTGGAYRKENGKVVGHKPPPITLLQTGTVITVCTAILMTVMCVTFAVGFTVDKFWLPNPYFNYLSWSYGFAVLSTFFSIFATVAQVTCSLIVRQELREPPKSVNMSGYLTPPDNRI